MYIEELNKLKIGDRFMVGDKVFEIVKDNDRCDNCDFKDNGCGVLNLYGLRPECHKFARKDKTNVIFKEVE